MGGGWIPSGGNCTIDVILPHTDEDIAITPSPTRPTSVGPRLWRGGRSKRAGGDRFDLGPYIEHIRGLDGSGLEHVGGGASGHAFVGLVHDHRLGHPQLLMRPSASRMRRALPEGGSRYAEALDELGLAPEPVSSYLAGADDQRAQRGRTCRPSPGFRPRGFELPCRTRGISSRGGPCPRAPTRRRRPSPGLPLPCGCASDPRPPRDRRLGGA